MAAVQASGGDVNRSMAWQYKFLAFNLLVYGLTQEIGGCIVDGTPYHQPQRFFSELIASTGAIDL